jgi:tRNA pseudouridine55 synthase
VGGRRAYQLAREGTPVELPPRPVVVHKLEILAYDWPLLTLRVECGKGTYIRSIARDLGRALNVGGMLRGLRRTRSGTFTVDRAKRLDQLPDVLTQSDLLPLSPTT